MTVPVQRLILVLALAAFATPALSETVRRPANGGAAPSVRAEGAQLSSEELSAATGGRPSEASSRAAVERMAVARKAIEQVLGSLPAARKAG